MARQILIVDDCSTTRKLLSLLVKGQGHSPITAENGMDAMEKLAATPVDLIITDLNMPIMDGLEFIRTLRGEEPYREIPIIMVTTEGDQLNRRTSLQLGASAYMVKPVTKDRLGYEIAKYLSE